VAGISSSRGLELRVRNEMNTGKEGEGRGGMVKEESVGKTAHPIETPLPPSCANCQGCRKWLVLCSICWNGN